MFKYEYVLINMTNSNTMGAYGTREEAMRALRRWKTMGYPGFVAKRVAGYE